MKIIEDTPERLVIEDRPWALGIVLIGFALISAAMVFQSLLDGKILPALAGVFFVVGLIWALVKGVKRARLTLDARTRTATWQVRAHGGTTHQSWPLQTVQNSMVEVQREDGETYRISLKLASEPKQLPLTAYFAGFGRHEEINKRINDFLTRHRETAD